MNPSWMRKTENPTTDFNMQPPTYAEVTKAIMKMKSSASPCPLYQIIVIGFKKYPVLRSVEQIFSRQPVLQRGHSISIEKK